MRSRPPSADAPRVSEEHAAAFRLSRHHLVTRLPKREVARAAEDMAGAQAQVLPAAKASLAARTEGLGPEDVDRALWEDRTLVRSWSLRGAVHLIPARDYLVFARGCRVVRRWERWMNGRNLSLSAVERYLDAMREAMDRPRTRRELAALVSRALGVATSAKGSPGWGGPRNRLGFRIEGANWSMGNLVHFLSLRGGACYGPPRGNEPTFVRPDAWIPGWQELPIEAAEAEFLRRYLRAYGPASDADFAMWSGLSLTGAREILGRSEDDLARVTLGERPAWILKEDLRTLERSALDGPLVRLLPHFDAYLLGHKERSYLVDRKHYKRVYRDQGWISPVLLVDGRIAGTWEQERKGGSVRVRVEPFRPLTPSIRPGVRDEAERVAWFLGGDLDLKIARA